VTTAADGTFTAEVIPGQYDIIVWKKGFYPLRREVIAPWPTFVVGLEPAPELLHEKLSIGVPNAPGPVTAGPGIQGPDPGDDGKTDGAGGDDEDTEEPGWCLGQEGREIFFRV